LTNIQSVDPFTVGNGLSDSANLQTDIKERINQMNEKKKTTPSQPAVASQQSKKRKTFADVANKRRPDGWWGKGGATCQQISDYHFAVGNAGDKTMTREEANRITTSVDLAAIDTCRLDWLWV